MARNFLYKFARAGGRQVVAMFAAQQEREDANSRPVRFAKGACEDLRHAQVVARWQGRTLLGDVKGQEYDPFTGVHHLRVHHFNGEPWPVYPCVASFVRVLKRD